VAGFAGRTIVFIGLHHNALLRPAGGDIHGNPMFTVMR
jgi:hypothetical protein